MEENRENVSGQESGGEEEMVYKTIGDIKDAEKRLHACCQMLTNALALNSVPYPTAITAMTILTGALTAQLSEGHFDRAMELADRLCDSIRAGICKALLNPELIAGCGEEEEGKS